MDIRRFFRLSCLSVAGLFWAGCSGDSDSSTSVMGLNPGIEPESSSDALGTVSSDSQQFSSSSSEEQVPESSSGPDLAQSSSSDGESSSSAEEESSSSTEEFIMAKDSSVTCTRDSALVSACYSPDAALNYSCMDLQEFLKKDTLVSEKILNSWEEKLMSCGAIKESYAPLYGIFYDVCSVESKVISEMKCSDGRSYRNFKLDSNLVYTSTEEYDTAHGIVPEDLMQNCPQDSFALFADILADVQKELYERITWMLDETDISLTDDQRAYYEGILDRENKKLKGDLFPYYKGGYDYDVVSTSLNYESENWFDGYIAKNETCTDGRTVLTERYQEKYDKILEECLDIIDRDLRNRTAD